MLFSVVNYACFPIFKNLSNNPVGVPGAKVVRYILTNNTHIRKVDLTGAWILGTLLSFIFVIVHVNESIAN